MEMMKPGSALVKVSAIDDKPVQSQWMAFVFLIKQYYLE
jgi:hypothetical protein